jgi:hypothetical protein
MNKVSAFTLAGLLSVGCVAAASAQDALLSGLSNDTGMKRVVSTAGIPALNQPSQSLLSQPVPTGLLTAGATPSFKAESQAPVAPGSGFTPQVAGISELGQGMSVAAFGKSEGQPGTFTTASGGNPFATDGVKPMFGVDSSARDGALGVGKPSSAGVRLGK